MQQQISRSSDQQQSPSRQSLSSMSKDSQNKQLLKMFQSEDFTPDQVIKYFISTFDEPGPHQFLTHKLLTMSDKFVEYYIPQFCYMQVKTFSYSMDEFLEELCKRSISNYLKIMWCLHAYADTDRETPRFEKTERRLEAAMVNGEKKLRDLDMLANQDSVEFNISILFQTFIFQQELQKMFQEKEHRFNYVSLVARFIVNMVKISLTLKQKPLDQRKLFLAHQIQQGNKTIRRHRQTHKDLKYYWGILLPFERIYEHNDASNLVVRIIETDFACFNTKTRVPYRILVETISQKEIEQKSQQLEQQVSNDASTVSDSDSFLSMDEQPQMLESYMKDLTRLKMEDPAFDQLAQFQQDEVQLMRNSRRSSMVVKKRRSSWSADNIKPDICILDLKIQEEFNQSETDYESIPRKKSQETVFFDPKMNEPKPELLLSIEKLYNNDGRDAEPKIVKNIVGGPWGEDWDNKIQRIQETSPFKDFESYKVRAIIVKGGDDLRQELLAMQVIQKIDEVFRKAYLNLYLRPYEIIITSENSGILEFVPNTLAMDGLKKSIGKLKTLKQFYQSYFTDDVLKAQKNFVESLAAYSLVTYLLQIKDRHNGNILIDNQGHIVHIDFGFMLSNSPGNMNFESAPFKFTREYLDLMNGPNSQLFEYFQILMVRGFLEIRKSTQAIVQLVETMSTKSNFPCFKNFNLEVFRARFKENDDQQQCEEYVHELIRLSTDNWRTVQYDNYQKLTNGIEP